MERKKEEEKRKGTLLPTEKRTNTVAKPENSEMEANNIYWVENWVGRVREGVCKRWAMRESCQQRFRDCEFNHPPLCRCNEADCKKSHLVPFNYCAHEATAGNCSREWCERSHRSERSILFHQRKNQRKN